MPKKRFQVRASAIQGLGAFATERIRKGTSIIEYVGERISSAEADARYEGNSRGRVVLFRVDHRTVIDAGVGGNEAPFINHSCEPNCEAVNVSGRIFIQALRTIFPGEELVYDYSLTRDPEDDAQTERDFACHCGAPTCRGTMLEPLTARRKRKAKRSVR